MIKKKLLASVMLVSLIVSAFPKEGMATPGLLFVPIFAMDVGRSITGIIQGVINLAGDGDAHAELLAKQEIVNKNADGTSDSSPNQATTQGVAGETTLTNGAYAYVKREILDQADISQYKKLQANLSNPQNIGNSETTCQAMNWTGKGKETCMAVVNTFFADKGKEENTQEYKDLIRQQRNEYVSQISQRHIVLGQNIQNKIIQDLRAASQSPVSSDNEIGAIAIDGQTLDEMLKIAVADVGLQIEMMEADAMAFMLQTPIEMLSSDCKNDYERETTPAEDPETPAGDDTPTEE